MLDATYFKESLHAQIRELVESCCTVYVHLTDGTEFRVKGLNPDQVYSGYVLFEVYPAEGVTKTSKAKRRKLGGNDKVLFDRLAVPYEYISRVFLTLVAPESDDEPDPIGFVPVGGE
jgi:hypothetical protein